MRKYQTTTAWKENLIRLISGGVPEEAALHACRVGKSKFYEELDLDQEFARRVAAAREV